MVDVHNPKIKRLKTNEARGEPWQDDFRLPSTVHPDHYDLYLNPDLDTRKFSGKVTIHVTSSEARDFLLVHTKWLTISNTKVVKVTEYRNEVSINN